MNYKQTLRINGKKVFVSINYGKISIGGAALNQNIKVEKIQNGKINFIDTITGESLHEYHGLSIRNFVISLVNKNIVVI